MVAFFAIIALSFGAVAYSLNGLVSSSLYSERIRQDSVSVKKLASALAPFLRNADAVRLGSEVASEAGAVGGRLVVLDTDAKVQCDSFGMLYGVRLQMPEVLSVLTGGMDTAYGVHRPDSGNGYAAYCAAQMVDKNGTVGVLLMVSPVDDLLESLLTMEKQMITVFVVAAAAALLAALFFSNLLTKPIVVLTDIIRRMGHGELSARVPVRGAGELRDLAVSYNTMAEQLESLDKSRSQFVSNASHELKTPLTTMKICLENVIYQPDMPQELRTEFLQDIDHEIDRLSGIVTDLLTLSRMDSHAIVLALAPCDLSGMTAETLRILQPIAQKRRQQLLGEIEPGIIGMADRSRMEQVIYNLTENALKYTRDGGRIEVSLKQSKGKAVWQIRDNGVGIPQEDLPHIFDRFYRVDKARSRETGGTGLGLSIVRQLVSMHGGTVAVESEPGKGSVFTVEIPLGREAAP